ncbi:tRNA (adenosine(37)-N6)-dimethylallyltransferase MiaA [Larsenimonas suaedae]|uniref:tRNA dimethylallyltransferase n=1 Tax=Larsenimonas suaedae TaxID=1851019 RepID=A0ABU1GY34_9GAMM|nr:tRNA (adenosine(37)-N6)-dimethylallyltransferase MiaA [Larsenimonas suaedae]MCM2972856.1 tRNA (adenosine(37)-N6)-dimethylallyltransferase MiaA [Larsenimonas suaedae]MDR5896955.1 tRNA (adenosine(37)-N6)-dimethylallyltransferase MiaA [Larsenimonas suaedae]
MRAPSGKPYVPFIMGPTAAGKTDLAIALHERLGFELISVDSAMVYRGMDIGSAKPTADELARAPHRLIDIRDPSEPYSAAEFRDDALGLIDALWQRGQTPLLIGGTMLYFKVLVDGAASMPGADAAVREQLQRDIEQRGLSALHEELARVDPVAAERIHPNDPQRLTRALEVYRLTGRSLTSHWEDQSAVALPFEPLPIVVCPGSRALLHERIAMRFDQMLELGIIEEVEALKARPEIHADLPAMKSVGYRQVWEYLDGRFDRSTLRERGVVATRQLAKRQLTWLRRWQHAHWIDPQAEDVEASALKIVRGAGT